MPNKRQHTLTKKEQDAINYFLTGDNQTEAVFKAFNCKNRNTAGAIATRVFGKEKVKKEVSRSQQAITQRLDDKLAKRTLKFVEIVEKYAPPHKIAKRLAENILSKDKRVSDSAIDKYIKLRGDYAPTKELIMSRSDIYQEIKELPEESPEESLEDLMLPGNENQEDKEENKDNEDNSPADK